LVSGYVDQLRYTGNRRQYVNNFSHWTSNVQIRTETDEEKGKTHERYTLVD